MTEAYDVIVIGSGPGGYIAALQAAQMGATVAVVEKHQLGGTCLNYGCIPSKALLASSELLHNIEHADTLGVRVEGATFDWTAIQKRKDKVLRQLRGGIGGLFKARNITQVAGHGRLDGPGRVTVETEAGMEVLTGRNIILAIGSTPARIPAWPSDPEIVCTSDEVLHWDSLPKSLLIVGGGVIGCEFACMMQSFGVEVTVVEMLPGLLPGMEPDLGDALHASLAKRGIKMYLDTKVDDLSIAGGGAVARLSNNDVLNIDRVLVAVGRRPATEDIGLDRVGIETDRGFVQVDEFLQTSAENVYCIGDANGQCLLAHAASAHAVRTVRNALGCCRKPFRQVVPGAVYTYPEIGAVGQTSVQLDQAGIPYTVGTFPLGHLGKAMAVGETEGFVKVLRERGTDKLLGVHMLGHNATECIAAAGAMIQQGATVKDLTDVVIAHPTISESIHEAAEDAIGAALHLPPRKVLRMAADVG